MLENGNVGFLRCLNVEKWKSLAGIWSTETYDVSEGPYHGLALGVLVPLVASLPFGLL